VHGTPHITESSHRSGIYQSKSTQVRPFTLEKCIVPQYITFSIGYNVSLIPNSQITLTGGFYRCSTASVSATASEIIAVDDLYYNNKLNPGLAIFMLFSSQLLGYGFAGYELETILYHTLIHARSFLREFLVFPTLTWWPTIITTANVRGSVFYVVVCDSHASSG
jgi:hypothetical protein